MGMRDVFAGAEWHVVRHLPSTMGAADASGPGSPGPDAVSRGTLEGVGEHMGVLGLTEADLDEDPRAW